MTNTDAPGRLASLTSEARAAIEQARDADALQAARKQYLGRKGSISGLNRLIGTLDAAERPKFGALLQRNIRELEEFADQRADSVGPEEVEAPYDPTIPAATARRGSIHPTIQLMNDLNDAFSALNFTLFSGPEISSEGFEFDKMNFPDEHPARESMDTYWISETLGETGNSRLCLRPHLTGASVRYMQGGEPPFRFVYPGRVYRNESVDARHERAFFQYEALIVDRDVSMTSGKFMIDTILDTVFGRQVRTRMRAGFFPFVEPGFEIDMECQVCGGVGCRTCHGVGWIEIMPGGVPHPNVLRSAGLDPLEWSGFYINVGLDRLVMMRYEIDDIRWLHSGDLRFLGQFA